MRYLRYIQKGITTMPRKPKETKPESELTPVEIAVKKLDSSLAAFKKKSTPAAQKELIESTDLYRGAMISELG